MKILHKKKASEIVYLIGLIVGVISLFMPWKQIGFTKIIGIKQQGILFLLVMLYPCYTIIKGVDRSKIIALIFMIFNTVAVLLYLSKTTIDLFGVDINTADLGIYVMILSTLINLFAAMLDFKKPKSIQH